jgi:hypothetical protein
MSFILSEDLALKTALSGIVVVDEKNSSRPVGVWFSTPDIESRSQSYPYITIDLIDTNHARYRQTSGLFVDNDAQGTIAPVAGNTYTYEIPVAWDLKYQITTYSRHPRHDRAILASLLNNVFPATRGYLAVPNDLGTETSYRHLIVEDLIKRDTIEDGRRLYRNVFTISITSEGSRTTTTPTPQATDVLINNPPITYVPSDKQPV